MTYYFIKDGDSESGPYTIEQLKYRFIKKDTPVWFAALTEWTTAGQLHELKELFITNPASRFPKSKNKLWENKLLRIQLKKFRINLS